MTSATTEITVHWWTRRTLRHYILLLYHCTWRSQYWGCTKGYDGGLDRSRSRYFRWSLEKEYCGGNDVLLGVRIVWMFVGLLDCESADDAISNVNVKSFEEHAISVGVSESVVTYQIRRDSLELSQVVSDVVL